MVEKVFEKLDPDWMFVLLQEDILHIRDIAALSWRV
jgi:hypothetical protein